MSYDGFTVWKLQREKHAALKKILMLEQQLDAKQKLELEIQQLKGKLKVMEHMPGDENSAAKNKINELSEALQEKIDELDGMESLNQTLVIKESKSNIELQEARNELENVCYLTSINWCSQFTDEIFVTYVGDEISFIHLLFYNMLCRVCLVFQVTSHI